MKAIDLMRGQHNFSGLHKVNLIMSSPLPSRTNSIQILMDNIHSRKYFWERRRTRSVAFLLFKDFLSWIFFLTLFTSMPADTVHASTFSRSGLSMFRTEPYYTLYWYKPKNIRFAKSSVLYAKNSMRVRYSGIKIILSIVSGRGYHFFSMVC